MLVAMMMGTTVTVGRPCWQQRKGSVRGDRFRHGLWAAGFGAHGGVRAGRLTDRIGAHRITVGALALFTAGGHFLSP
jgi:hypothetical protein